MSKDRKTQLRSLTIHARELLTPMDVADVETRSAPDTWSKQEILGHLIDSAYNNHHRIVHASAQEDLVFDGYDQDHWVTSHDYQGQAWLDVVSTWSQANLHLSTLIGNIPGQIIRRPTTQHNFHEIGYRKVERGAPVSLDVLIEDYMAHMIHHLKQIIPVYESPVRL